MFEDIFNHASAHRDFKVQKATELPELKEDQLTGGYGGGYGNG